MPSPDRQPLTRRQWLGRIAAGGVTLALGSYAYARRIEPHWVEITHHTMPLMNLSSSLVGKRLVQISDLHVGPVVDNSYLRTVLRSLEELGPDYLVITGDLMSSRRAESVDLVIDTLRDSPVIDLPTFIVLGNHDYGEGFRNDFVADELVDKVRNLGVTVLRNESIDIDGLQIAGCDDRWARRTDLNATFARVDHTRPTICLAHNPDIADLPDWSTFGGWILSGHTHGGQCRFPIIGAPVLPIKNKAYARGHVSLNGGRNLYVNRGLGYTRRIRFGVRPEVTVFTLTPV
ncbi:metallophosphoesterase [Botrimarina mediterranea]|uniref:Putative metallophosphoesterase n=1 Tax=Botrimarina mediterranea TaxID=2528022 RepID=A0A518KF14_9BACT|nr:metallophosphoesterase [Botrimarina mediterranea]QDV76387.1 putative metallophosphoesterase [Botrimarina mediterranea]